MRAVIPGFLAVLLAFQSICVRAQVEPPARTFPALDSLSIGAEEDPDARAMLERFAYAPGPFAARLFEEPARPIVRFPSPLPRGDPRNDTVVLEWFKAAGAAETDLRPAMLVMHILDGRMKVARTIATALSSHGIHSFVMHMPDYGERGTREQRQDARRFLARSLQGVADTRRARDAIAVLPGVDPDRIGIQGTSLGGFTASLAAALDGAFDPVFLMLAGGDLVTMFDNGRKDTEKIRSALEQAGVTVEEMRAILRAIDPVRIAHRLDPQRTWLYSARLDQVVPKESAAALGRAAGLDAEHHVWLPGNHYTCLPFLPAVLVEMKAIITEPGGQ